MAGFTKKTEKNVEFAKGGNTPMFGPQAAGEQASGETAHDTSDNGGKFATGGSNKMFGYAPSETAKAGITSAR